MMLLRILIIVAIAFILLLIMAAILGVMSNNILFAAQGKSEENLKKAVAKSDRLAKMSRVSLCLAIPPALAYIAIITMTTFIVI